MPAATESRPEMPRAEIPGLDDNDSAERGFDLRHAADRTDALRQPLSVVR